jgi:hypothetical protein
MKLKAPSLSPGKRAALERTLEWLISLRSELDPPKARLDELRLLLREAESRKTAAEKDAAVNPDAALALAGADSQLSRLAPQVKQLQRSLEQQTATAMKQVNHVRGTELRELLFGPLIEQLFANIATAISPFFADSWARQHARNIAQQECPQYRQIMFYLNLPPITAIEFDDAKREINTLVGEIKKILAGGTLLEV